MNFLIKSYGLLNGIKRRAYDFGGMNMEMFTLHLSALMERLRNRSRGSRLFEKYFYRTDEHFLYPVKVWKGIDKIDTQWYRNANR